MQVQIFDMGPILRIIEEIIYAPFFGLVVCILIPFGFIYKIIKRR